MTKKGYQKRLPTVPPPEAAPPRPPRPRAARDAGRARRSAAATPPVAAVLHRDGPPPGPDADALRAAEPALARTHQPDVEPDSEPDSDTGVAIGVGVGVGAVMVVVFLGALLAFLLLGDPAAPPTGRGPGGTDAARAPAGLGADESEVQSQVLPNGDVVVHQWIHAAEPVSSLRLALPKVTGAAGLAATDVLVVADGTAAAGPARIAGGRATYLFAGTTDVEVSYVLRGAVERSASAPGRALAVTTSLDVLYAPLTERETRVVRAPAVLSLACSPSPAVPAVPCGTASSGDRWQVELTGERVADRVVAQLDLV